MIGGMFVQGEEKTWKWAGYWREFKWLIQEFRQKNKCIRSQVTNKI